MSIEVRIDKIKASARGRAVELTIIQDGRPFSTERLIFPANLSKAEVRDRIGRLALARTAEESQPRPDWELQPGHRIKARDLLRVQVTPGQGQMEN